MSSQTNFTIVKEFIRAIEVRDRALIERSLAANVRATLNKRVHTQLNNSLPIADFRYAQLQCA